MTVLELSELVEAIEERFGVSANGSVAMAMAQRTSGREEAEQTEFDDPDWPWRQKIQAIKVVREITGLGGS